MKLAVKSSPHFAAYPLRSVELTETRIPVLRVTSHHFEEAPFAVETKVFPMINPYKAEEYLHQKKQEQDRQHAEWFANYE